MLNPGSEMQEESNANKKEEYRVIFHVEGQFTAYISVDPDATYNEMEGLAMERWLAADFGDIHHVHGDIDHIENSHGDRY